MKRFHQILLGLMLVLSLAVLANAETPNPCGEKASGNAMNPCSHKGGYTFYIDDPMNRNSVTFKSEAPLEDIVGTSNSISGYIHFDPENPNMGGHGEIIVPVASLNTGIPLRDEHLRSADWLNADNYPDINLTIDNIKNIKKVKSSDGAYTYDITVEGEFSFNGFSKRTSFSGRITYLKESDQTRMRQPGDLLAVRAEFDVPLKAYNVNGPEGMSIIGSKVSEEISVAVSFVSSTQSNSMAKAGNPCGQKAGNPCGQKAMNPCGQKAEAGNAGNPCAMKSMDNK